MNRKTAGPKGCKMNCGQKEIEMIKRAVLGLIFTLILSACQVNPAPELLGSLPAFPVSQEKIPGPVPASVTYYGLSGMITAFAIDPLMPAIFYAGAQGGALFKSTDGGKGWMRLEMDFSDSGVRALVVDPISATLYLAGDRLYKSTDRGATWKEINTGISNSRIHALAIDPATPTTIFAGTEAGIFKSTNGGETWAGLNTGFSALRVQALAINPLFPSNLFAATQIGVLKSRDGGQNWVKIYPKELNSSVTALAIDPVMQNTVYVGTQDGALLKSTNGGTTWEKLNAIPNAVRNLSIDPSAPNILYAGTDQGVITSVDYGKNWDANPHVAALTLASDFQTPPIFYAGGSGRVYKSTDRGLSWTAFPVGPPSAVFNKIKIDPLTPSTLYTLSQEGTLFKSSDAGQTWSQIKTGLAPARITELAIDPVTPTHLYIGVTGAAQGLLKSSNAGQTWIPVVLGPNGPNITGLVIDPITPTNLYAVIRGGYQGTRDAGVFKSTDGGETWNNTIIGSLRDDQLYNVVIAPALPGIDPPVPTQVYVATSKGVLKSSEGEEHWMKSNPGLTDLNVTVIAIQPASPNMLYFATRNGHIFRSINSGESWNELALDRPHESITALVIDPQFADILYASTDRHGLIKIELGDS
jgi:photosystem II stability/assembly factor-like uncharacterized protein